MSNEGAKVQKESEATFKAVLTAAGNAGVTAIVANATAPSQNALTTAAVAAMTMFPIALDLFTTMMGTRFGIFARSYDRKIADGSGAADYSEAKTANGARAVYEAMRALMDALDDAVAAPIARLTAHYTANDLKPDRFYRETARLLCELNEEELRDVQALFAAMASVEGPPGQWLQLANGRSHVGVMVGSIEQRQVDVVDADRIVRLLSRHEIGDNPGLNPVTFTIGQARHVHSILSG